MTNIFFGKSFGEYKITCPTDVVNYLLDTVYVACVGGESFGNDNCLRFSYASSDENLIEAARRIKEALDKLV